MSALEDREALTEITQPFSMLTQIRPVDFLYFFFCNKLPLLPCSAYYREESCNFHC